MSTGKLLNRPYVSIIVINFMLFMSFQLINPTLPIFLQNLNASASTIGLLISFINISALFSRPIAGRLIDRVGRRPLMVLSLPLVGLFIHLYVVFPVIWALFVIRLLHGAAWSFATTGSNTIASTSIPRHLMGKGMSYFGLSNALAQAIGPGIGLWLMTLGDFKLAVNSSVALLVVCTVMAFFYPYKELAQNAEKSAKPDSVAKSTGFFEHSAIPSSIMMFGVTVVMISITTFIALYGKSLGFDNVGLFFTFNALGVLVTRPLLGIAIERFGIFLTLAPCLISIMIGLGILGFATSLPMLYVSGIFCGMGCGGAHTALQTLAVMNAPANRFGAATATFFLGFDLGMIFGSVFSGMLVQAFGYDNMYHIIIILPLLSLLMALKIRSGKKTA